MNKRQRKKIMKLWLSVDLAKDFYDETCCQTFSNKIEKPMTLEEIKKWGKMIEFEEKRRKEWVRLAHRITYEMIMFPKNNYIGNVSVN